MKNYKLFQNYLFWRTISIISIILFLSLSGSEIIPKITSINQTITDLNSEQELVKLSENWQENLKILNNEEKRELKKYTEIFKEYPEQFQISNVIRTLNDIAFQNSININSIKQIKSYSFEGYEEILINIELNGSFKNMGNFIDAIERSKTSILFKKLDIHKKDISDKIVSADIVASVINIKDNWQK